MSKTLRIPVIVCQNGHISTGFGQVDADDTQSKPQNSSDWDVSIDCLPEAAYASGYRIVTVSCEIDVEAVFADFKLKGTVES